MSTARKETPLPKRRRWGLRTLGCLTVAIFAMIIAGIQGFQTLGTLGSVVFGLIGATYCSVRGVQDLVNLEWYRRRLIREQAAEEPVPDDNWRVGGSQ